ncbi:MAG: helix-turn-helix transcriptional regulator, partial [Planctomycetaceae bacterium]|nr:helix-turn-helix transcriptional regulator [Planctomycetaceae bacterium]
IEVVQLIAMGFDNRDIADQLDLSVKTVETHRARDGEDRRPQPRRPGPLRSAPGLAPGQVRAPRPRAGLPPILRRIRP